MGHPLTRVGRGSPTPTVTKVVPSYHPRVAPYLGCAARRKSSPLLGEVTHVRAARHHAQVLGCSVWNG